MAVFGRIVYKPLYHLCFSPGYAAPGSNVTSQPSIYNPLSHATSSAAAPPAGGYLPGIKKYSKRLSQTSTIVLVHLVYCSKRQQNGLSRYVKSDVKSHFMPPSKRLDLLPCRADADHRREFNSSTDNLKAMIRTLRRKDSATGCSVSSQSRLICVLLRRVFCHKPHTSSSSPLIISYFKSSCLRHDSSLSLRVY